MPRIARVELATNADNQERIELTITGLERRRASSGLLSEYLEEPVRHAVVALDLDAALELRAKLDVAIRQLQRRGNDRSRA